MSKETEKGKYFDLANIENIKTSVSSVSLVLGIFVSQTSYLSCTNKKLFNSVVVNLKN